MERPPKKYVCEKCGYLGDTSEHEGCDYLAWTTGEQLYIDRLELAALRDSPASAPEDMKLSEPTILPDGRGFGILSLPLPKDHWLYAEREYEEGAIEPNDLPAPILTHSFRRLVIAAIRYAIRSATNCGKEDDFDPDALVQNAVYALCGPYGKATAPTPPENKALLEAVAEVVWYDPQLSQFPEKPGKIIDGSIAFMESAEIGTKLFAAPVPSVSEDRKDVEVTRRINAAPFMTYKEECESLREQVEKLKAELKSIDGALDDPRANLTLTTSEIIWELKDKLEKLTKERDALIWEAATQAERETMEQVLAALGDIAGTSSSTRIRRVANDALTAIRARRK